ncbi:MerR family transcriptional regulator [Variovorax paradoxus]
MPGDGKALSGRRACWWPSQINDTAALRAGFNEALDLERALISRINAMETSLTIAEVAKRTGLTAYTLRYYERIGLIAAVPRAPGGQRRYASADMDLLDFLLRLRETGMSIQGMQAFVRLRSQGDASVGERREMLEQHLAEVQARVAALQQSMQALSLKIGHYRKVEKTKRRPPPSGKAREGKTSNDEHTEPRPRRQPALHAWPGQAPGDRR